MESVGGHLAVSEQLGHFGLAHLPLLRISARQEEEYLGIESPLLDSLCLTDECKVHLLF